MKNKISISILTLFCIVGIVFLSCQKDSMPSSPQALDPSQEYALGKGKPSKSKLIFDYLKIDDVYLIQDNNVVNEDMYLDLTQNTYTVSYQVSHIDQDIIHVKANLKYDMNIDYEALPEDWHAEYGPDLFSDYYTGTNDQVVSGSFQWDGTVLRGLPYYTYYPGETFSLFDELATYNQPAGIPDALADHYAIDIIVNSSAAWDMKEVLIWIKADPTPAQFHVQDIALTVSNNIPVAQVTIAGNEGVNLNNLHVSGKWSGILEQVVVIEGPSTNGVITVTGPRLKKKVGALRFTARWIRGENAVYDPWANQNWTWPAVKPYAEIVLP
ncbi:hypothetical protein JXO59_01390 [candidate division KSB1 bacterium]|nr:hypothetical protein [candidate division KSB1 bacterium]